MAGHDYTPHKYNTIMDMLKQGAAQGAERVKQQQELEGQKSNKLAEMLAQHKDDSDYQNEMIGRAKDLQSQMGSRYNVTLSKEGVHLGENPVDPASKIGPEGSKLYAAGKKVFDPLQQQTDTMELMHKYLQNPSSLDQNSLQVLQARLQEGPGQRLLQSVIQHAAGDKTAPGQLEALQNYWTGKASGTLQPDQLNKMRESLFQRQSELGDQISRAKQGFGQQAPLLAPHLVGSQTYDTAMNSFSQPLADSMGRLSKIQGDFQSQAGPTGTKLNQPPAPPYTPPQNLWDKLTAKNSTSPPTAPKAGPKPGDIDSGHKFKGGDPADPNSWEQVQ